MDAPLDHRVYANMCVAVRLPEIARESGPGPLFPSCCNIPPWLSYLASCLARHIEMRGLSLSSQSSLVPAHRSVRNTTVLRCLLNSIKVPSLSGSCARCTLMGVSMPFFSACHPRISRRRVCRSLRRSYNIHTLSSLQGFVRT